LNHGSGPVIVGVILGVSLMHACGGRVDGTSSDSQAAGGTSAASGATGNGGNGGASTGGNGDSCTLGFMPREELPACAYVDACYSPGSWYWPCSTSANCAFTFEQPLDNLGTVNVGCTAFYLDYALDPPQLWELSVDQKTVFLKGAACESWHAQTGPQVVMKSVVHSCIL
jgi:hypothetical protein